MNLLTGRLPLGSTNRYAVVLSLKIIIGHGWPINICSLRSGSPLSIIHNGLFNNIIVLK
jgi:hypothetical protein